MTCNERKEEEEEEEGGRPDAFLERKLLCAVVPRRARISGSQPVEPLISRLERDIQEEEVGRPDAFLERKLLVALEHVFHLQLR